MESPARGTTFQHQRFLDPNTNTPLRCKVTTVRAGNVYFRPFYGQHEDGTDWLGAPYFLPLKEWTTRYAVVCRKGQ